MTDLEIIKQIEKELNISLEELDKTKWPKNNYSLSPIGKITRLVLRNCNLRNFNRILSLLKALTNLIELDLSHNQLIDILAVSALTNLTQLNLIGNQVSDISPLSALTNLTELYLNNNQISDISPIAESTSLTRLDLRNNQVSDISLLSTLTNLTELCLTYNEVNDVSPLSDLKNLTELYLSANQISDIFHIKDLTNLTKLSFSSNKVTDISSLKYLTNLTELDFSNNKVTDISSLKYLTNLTELYLRENQLSDISPLKALTYLSKLDLSGNLIEELPPWITDFYMGIKWNEEIWELSYIDLFDNPLKSPPPEIVAQGKEAVRNYFEQLKEQKEDYIFEAKLLIIGEAGAGKTSMARKIEDSECTLPREDETTKGIDVKQYYFPLHKEDFKSFRHPDKLENKNFRLNLWDFGGQEIYKATHRFFLSKDCLYALVADSRNENTDFNYWLHIVEMFGGDSPLLIVLNEKQQRKRNLDIAAMKNRFTNISDVIEVDFAEMDKTRLNKLEQAVRYYVSRLPHIGSPVPSKWTKIREALENDTRNTISLQDYLQICKDNTISKTQDALVLSRYFHDIGVFLHFQDDDLLEETIFLKSNWATNAVYKILDDPLLNKQNGRFNKNDAKNIWHEDEYSLIRSKLLRLMQKFFLTYEIDNSGNYIVPERLPAAKPDYSWDEKGNLFFRYKYDYFMPRGIMSQFIVQMHRYICDHNLVWRRGVIIEWKNTTAEILESYDSRVISIRISGKNRRDFMTLITEQLDKINAQFEKMKVEKLIPCNCDSCRKNQEPHFYQHDILKEFISNEQFEIQCQKKPYKMVNVRSLIDEVINESMRGRQEEENICYTQKIKRDSVFISYCQKDGHWLERVQTHLNVLKNLGITVNVWDDTKIKAGQEWFKEIERALSSAKAAILLVSTDFLASDFINKKEIPPLLDAAQNDDAVILPLILKPCMFEESELSDFQAVNKPAEPLSDLNESDQEKALVKLTKRVKELIRPPKKETI